MGLPVMLSLHTPCSSLWAPGLSLTWAEALALLRGTLRPLLGGAGRYPSPSLRLSLHTLVLLFTGTVWLLEPTRSV